MRALSTALVAAMTLLPLTIAPVAMAQAPVQPITDTIDLSLKIEEWVKAETARVILIVDAAGSGDGGGLQRADILKAADAVADKVEWRVTAMDKVSDSAGLDRWRTLLEARLPESRLASLAERAKKASRPGLQVRIGAVTFEPTLAEKEAARKALRLRLYARINEEIALLKQAFPDRSYRVKGLSFEEYRDSDHEDVGPPPPPRTMMSESMEEIIVSGSRNPNNAGASGQEDKMILQADVSLGAFASPTP